MFFEIGVLKNFALFRGKQLCWSVIFDKVAGQQLSSEYCEIFKNSFFHKTPPLRKKCPNAELFLVRIFLYS